MKTTITAICLHHSSPGILVAPVDGMKNKYTSSSRNLLAHSRPLGLDSKYGFSFHVLNVTGKHPFGNAQELKMYTYTRQCRRKKKPQWGKRTSHKYTYRKGGEILGCYDFSATSPSPGASSSTAVDLIARIPLVPLLPGGAGSILFPSVQASGGVDSSPK